MELKTLFGMEDRHMSSKTTGKNLHLFCHVVAKMLPIRLAGFLFRLRTGGGAGQKILQLKKNS